MCDLSSTPTRAATGRFVPGCSGNPAGRPRGARNKASGLREMLDAAESEAVVRAIVDRALSGDWPALRACFTRLVPPAKAEPVEIDLPPIATVADVADAGAALIAAVAAGEISPGDAQKVMNMLTRQLKLLSAAPPHAARDEIAVDAGASPIKGETCISPVFTDAPPSSAGFRADQDVSAEDAGPDWEEATSCDAGSSARQQAPWRPYCEAQERDRVERAGPRLAGLGQAPPPQSAASLSDPVDVNACISPVLTAATQSFANLTSFTAKPPPVGTSPFAEAARGPPKTGAATAVTSTRDRAPRLREPSRPFDKAQNTLRGDVQPRSPNRLRGTRTHPLASLLPGSPDGETCISPVISVGPNGAQLALQLAERELGTGPSPVAQPCPAAAATMAAL